jgi:hypothetical protein
MSKQTTLKKNTAEFENMIRFYLEKSKDPLFPIKTRNISPELEIRFGINKKQSKPISKIDYDNVVVQLLLNGWVSDNIEGVQMLRISNEYYDKYKKTDIIQLEPKPESEPKLEKAEKTDNADTDQSTELFPIMNGGGKRTNMRMSGSIRVEIMGIDLIKAYCKTNSIDYLIRNDSISHHKIKFTEKMNIKDDNAKEIKQIDFYDYNFRVAYKAEKDTSIRSENMKYRNILLNWNTTRKNFRLMNRVRFYHDQYPVYIDLSIVKTNNKFTRKQKNVKTDQLEEIQVPNYTHTIQECHLFDNPSTYEIELELDNAKAKTYEFDHYITDVRSCIRLVLSGLQQTPYPISYDEQEQVIEQYMERMFGESWKETKRPYPFFIGPNSVTLQLENILKDDDESSIHSSIVKITEGYTVTEKADGLRSLLYVSKTGKLYMIDTNMKVKFTGSLTKEKYCFDSIIDGEFIQYGKNSDLLYLFAAFDIYYIGGRTKQESVRDLDFCSANPLDEDTNYRLPLLQHFVSILNPQPVVENTSCRFQVQTKTFHCHYNESQDIFKASNVIWSRHKESFPYQVDGLIYTPMNLGVGGNKSKRSSDLKSVRWDHSFKWKPPEYNTIDFLVEVKKNNGKELIQHEVIQNEGFQKVIQYKTLILHCGFNAEMKSMNPFSDMLHDKIPSKQQSNKHNNDYKPHPFQPTVPYDQNAHICHVPLEIDEVGNLQMKTVETKEAFHSNMIVEFAYMIDDKNKEGPWKWVPLRVRYDKQSRLINGEKMYGNDFDTANNNWKSIHFPVTEDIISGNTNKSDKINQEIVYYNSSDRLSKTTALRDFHNLYVKRKLISGVANYLIHKLKVDQPILMDYAVGKAGDLAKWRHSDIEFVLGIDISRSNIMEQRDGACARYLTHRRDFPYSKLRALFVHGNSGLNIRSQGKAFYDTFTKELVQSVFGSGVNMNKKQKCFEHGIARDGFHISSCMFALHYFFQSNTTLHNFLRNLSECTRLNGYFIGTCFDGQKVFQLLSNKKENESIRIEKDGSKVFEIMKGYKGSIKTLPTDDECIGMPIYVYQDSIGSMFIEYLVNFQYFVQLMENYGFVLVSKQDAEKMGFTESNSLFDTLYRKMERENYKEMNKREFENASFMSDYEQTISFLNRYFIFQKKRDLSQTNLNNLEPEHAKMITDDIIKGEEEDKIIETKPVQEEPKAPKAPKEPKAQKTPKVRKVKSPKRIKIDSDNYVPVE